jgi:hypothetical protein
MATLGAIAPVPTSTFTGADAFLRTMATFGAIAPVPTSTLTGVEAERRTTRPLANEVFIDRSWS